MLPNPILELGPLKIHMYGVMIAVGILFAFLVLFTYSKKLKINDVFTDFIFYNAIVSIAIGFGSAALFQAFYDYIENPEAGFKISGSITFIGGLIGGAACFLLIYFLFRKRLPGKLTDSLSIVPCAITVAHGFGRIGCFFAGCCHGGETDFFLGVSFAPGSAAYRNFGDAKLHPTQLYEAAFLFVIFGIMTYLLLKHSFRHNMSIYLVTYGIFRFLNEYLRADHRGELVGAVSPSQFWSIFMVLIGVALYFLVNYFDKKKNATEAKA